MKLRNWVAAVSSAVVGMTVTGSALAQDTAATAQSADAAPDTTVVVTGSRQPRSATKSSSPIDIISAADLQKSGAVDMASALNELLPAFNLPAISGYDQSAIVRPGRAARPERRRDAGAGQRQSGAI